MKPLVYLTIIAALGTSCEALAVGGIANVSIINRDSGATLVPHYYRGEYWVAGNPGTRYAIEIRNRMGGRLLAITSVDGVNVVTGATAAWSQSGYVFDPGEAYQITGWRKSNESVAAFTFTDSSNSYAGRTGRPANLGIIGVAVFRERAPQRVYEPSAQIGNASDARGVAGAPGSSERADGPSAHADQRSAANAAAKSGPGANAPAPLTREAEPTRSKDLTPADKVAAASRLGTGHGDREYSYVSRTEFDRAQNEPDELIRIHYDSLENLVAMGIVRRPHPAPPSGNPFPASPTQQYVPDPPG